METNSEGNMKKSTEQKKQGRNCNSSPRFASQVWAGRFARQGYKQPWRFCLSLKSQGCFCTGSPLSRFSPSAPYRMGACGQARAQRQCSSLVLTGSPVSIWPYPYVSSYLSLSDFPAPAPRTSLVFSKYVYASKALMS